MKYVYNGDHCLRDVSRWASEKKEVMENNHQESDQQRESIATCVAIKESTQEKIGYHWYCKVSARVHAHPYLEKGQSDQRTLDQISYLTTAKVRLHNHGYRCGNYRENKVGWDICMFDLSGWEDRAGTESIVQICCEIWVMETDTMKKWVDDRQEICGMETNTSNIRGKYRGEVVGGFEKALTANCRDQANKG